MKMIIDYILEHDDSEDKYFCSNDENINLLRNILYSYHCKIVGSYGMWSNVQEKINKMDYVGKPIFDFLEIFPLYNINKEWLRLKTSSKL